MLTTGGQLGLLALAAFFSATIVNGIVAARLDSVPTARLDSAPAAAAPVRRTLASYGVITEKDIFNPPRPAAATAPAAQPVSELKARLLGTAPGTGIDSFAVIEDQTSKTQQLYRVGDPIQNRSLARVEWDHVVLKSGGREEILKMADPAGRPSAPAPAAAAEGGITQRGDTDFVIDRAEVERQMENLNQLFTQIRAVPHFQDGKANGFRLFAIRQDSIFDKIGLKNGDIIQSINGNELSDPARAMGLIQEMRNEGRITVTVNRNRQPTTLSYEIR